MVESEEKQIRFPNQERIGMSLALVIKRNDTTREKIAHELNLSPSTVGKKIKGQRPMFVEELVKICELLDVAPPSVFVNGLEDEIIINEIEHLDKKEKQLLLQFIRILENYDFEKIRTKLDELEIMLEFR